MTTPPLRRGPGSRAILVLVLLLGPLLVAGVGSSPLALAAVGSPSAPPAAGAGAVADAGPWQSPLPPFDALPPVLRAFDPPPRPWDAGHRGVDLAAAAGTAVHAAGAGTVSFAGEVAGTPVVTVTHGELRTTYQPVLGLLAVGAPVARGAPIGVLAAEEQHCPGRSCLHWGLRLGETYLDPMTLLGQRPRADGEVRLLPLGARTLTGSPPPPTPQRPPGRSDRLVWPVLAPRITSPFGMRTHPITGVHKLHDGTDFGAACGEPVFASAPGTVSWAGDRGGYGLQVGVAHAGTGPGLGTSYAHLSSIRTSPGATVAAGDVIGTIGSTGLSTGCHLHFMVTVGGIAQDPMSWLPAAP